MAGYSWDNGKSNNAIMAEESGKFPKSNITASLLKDFDIPLTVKDVKKLIELNIFKSREWHHTSSKFNETYFYDLNELKNMCEDEETFAVIKDSLSKKVEDIIYAKINVVDFTKSRGKWHPIFTEYVAEIKGYNTKIMCEITDIENNTFRKKVDNVETLETIKKEEFETIKKEKLKELEKKELSDKKENLLNCLNEYDDYFDNALVLKLKRARSVKTIEKLEKNIKEEIKKIEIFKKEEEKENRKKKIKEMNMQKENANIANMDILEWINLSKDRKHPAPKNVYEMKKESGLSWDRFEDFITNEYIKIGA